MPEEQALTPDAATPTTSFKQFDDLTSTVEHDLPPSQAVEAPSSQDAKPAEAANTDDKDKGGRLDRDGRFQQVLASNKELKTQLAQLTKQMETMQSSGKTSQETNAKGKSKGLLGMTPDELLDLQATDPVKYVGLLRESLLADINKESEERQIKGTYEKYASDNPDFEELWDSGEIQKFMAANPGHNTISAHQSLTLEKRIEKIKADALKEATEKLQADLRVKGKAAVVGQAPGGPATVASNDDQDLKDPKKFGGMYAVLSRRSRARESS